MFKEPKNTDKISWTKHSFEKMKQYELSPQRVLRIARHPERLEQSIVDGCLAAMQSLGKKAKTEIWVMYQDVIKNQKPHRRIITAWRYPGTSPKRDSIPIPQDIQDELVNLLK